MFANAHVQVPCNFVNKIMIIGIDGNEANVEKRVGIGEYAFELLRQFSSSKWLRASKVQNLKFIIYLKNKPLSDLPKEGENWKYRVIGPKKFWTQLALPLDLYLRKPRPSVFFTPSHYAPRFSPIPSAISIMDLSYIKYPELFKKNDLYQLRNWTSYSVKKSSKIFTISLASKNDIIKEYKLPESKVIVIYPGLKPMSEKPKSFMGKYILFVGTLQPRKNIVRLVEAFSKIKDKYPNLVLLVVGKKGWLFEEILNSPKKFGVEDKVRFLDFVKDEEMPGLYKKAQCFVLPSLYEGFGLPVLEAMKYGCPVILSNISSLPEAGGNAALYFNPQDPNDIAKKLNKVLSDEKLRSEMVKKGYEQVKKFSWEKTARETLKVLESIAK